MITLTHYLVLGALLFGISAMGIFMNRKNVLVLLMSIELMLLAVNFNFIAFSQYLGDTAGQIFVFFVLTVAAAESAIGLAIMVLVYRNRKTINVADLDELKGNHERHDFIFGNCPCAFGRLTDCRFVRQQNRTCRCAYGYDTRCGGVRLAVGLCAVGIPQWQPYQV